MGRKSKEKVVGSCQAINSEHVPSEFRNALIDDGADKLITVDDDGSPWSEWLKANGFVFNMPRHLSDVEIKKRKLSRWGWLAIWW